MDKITITVEGPTGSGKTAVCQLIAEVLAGKELYLAGLPPELSASTGYSERRSARGLETAIYSLRDRVQFDVVEKNLSRT